MFGHVKSVTPFLSAADLLVVTSDSEGMPAVVLEAGYLGLPVVARRVGGMEECVVHGETGLLVEAGEDALVEAIHGLMEDRQARERMGTAAMKRIRRGFTMDSVAERYLAFYSRMLTNGAPG